MSEVEKARAEKGGDNGRSRFIILWTLAIVCGFVLVFLGNLLAYENTPLPVYISSFEAITGALTVSVIGIGILMLLTKNDHNKPHARRNAVVVIVCGIFLVGSLFAFKSIIPLIFV